jgi:hypothetical protein
LISAANWAPQRSACWMLDDPVSSAYAHGTAVSVRAHSASPFSLRIPSTQSSARSTVGHR